MRGLDNCRNCGGIDVVLSPHGSMLPFFAKRVLDVEVVTPLEALDYRIATLPSVILRNTARLCVHTLDSIGGGFLQTRPTIRAEIRICRSCGFVGPARDFSEEELNRLYFDYRSPSYNEDRVRLEPSYARIQDMVGLSPIEIDARLGNVDRILRENLDMETLTSIGSVLDWAGGEGRFVPRALNDRRVVILDVSMQPPVNGAYERIGAADALNEKFDYLQLCHILEHVSLPRDLLSKAIEYLMPGGFLYVELPQDRSDTELSKIQKFDPTIRHFFHEHINLYSQAALRALGNSLGLREISISKTTMDVEWAVMQVVSGLFQRPPDVQLDAA